MKIGVWGDSITYGESDSEALGWVGRFRTTYAVEDRVRVYNRGICGDTTEDLLARFEVEATSIAPDVIIFAIGINDSKFPAGTDINKVPLENFRENIKQLLTKAHDFTDHVVVLGATRVQEGWPTTGSRFENEEISKYNQVLKEEADAEEFPFVDMFDVLDMDSDLYDGLHPNADGYAKMARHIKSETGL